MHNNLKYIKIKYKKDGEVITKTWNDVTNFRTVDLSLSFLFDTGKSDRFGPIVKRIRINKQDVLKVEYEYERRDDGIITATNHKSKTSDC